MSTSTVSQVCAPLRDSLPYHVTYIWLDCNNNFRQKVKLLAERPCDLKLSNFPEWNFDGSSTGQASREDSEVVLKPVRLYRDPFSKPYDGVLILCECYLANGDPHPDNTRHSAQKRFQTMYSEGKTLEEFYQPLYGMEQEFFIMKDGEPLEYNPAESQGKYYCSVSSQLNPIMKQIVDHCYQAGLGNVVGYNLEVAPGQAEFQLLEYGLKACDDLIMLRYLITTVLSTHGYDAEFHPKPLKGDWNGSGCHVNYSTNFMRDEYPEIESKLTKMTPYQHIEHAISKLEERHQTHISVYGKGNEERLTGEHETSSINEFSYGVANRGTSIRIPRLVYQKKSGYIEDRRPSSNFDPYLVLPLLLETTTMDLN